VALTDSTPTDAVISTGDEYEDAVQNTIELLLAFKADYNVGSIQDYDVVNMPINFPSLSVTYVSSELTKRTFGGKQNSKYTWDHFLNIWYYFANVEQKYREAELRKFTSRIVKILLKYPTINGFNNQVPAEVANVNVLERPLIDGFVASSRITLIIHREFSVAHPITVQGQSAVL